MKSLAVLLLFLPVLTMLACVLVMWMSMREQKRLQDTMVKKIKGRPYWRVYLARPAFMKRMFKLVPAECRGVLIDEGDKVRFAGRWEGKGQIFSWSVAKTGSGVEWVGNRSLKAGNLYWAKINSPEGEMYFSADTGFMALPSRQSLQDILFSAFPDFGLDEDEQTDFALEKNPRSKLAMGLILVPAILAMIDTYFISRFEMAEHQLLLLLLSPSILLPALLAGALLGFVLYRWLMGGGVPARESYALAIMAVLSLWVAYVPALKRLDQQMAQKGTQDFAYEVVGVGRLDPIDPGKNQPKLIFRHANEYWSQFEVGDNYEIPMVHGPLGLWQIDRARFDPPILQFYKDHPEL